MEENLAKHLIKVNQLDFHILDRILSKRLVTPVKFGKKTLKLCGTLGDLEDIGKKIGILNYYNYNQILRQIIFTDKKVIILVEGENYEFDKSHEVYFEEWFMDRGSYLIKIEGIEKLGKLATEHDPIIVWES